MSRWFQRAPVPLSLTLRDREAVVSKGEALAQVFRKTICESPAPPREVKNTYFAVSAPASVMQAPPPAHDGFKSFNASS